MDSSRLVSGKQISLSCYLRSNSQSMSRFVTRRKSQINPDCGVVNLEEEEDDSSRAKLPEVNGVVYTVNSLRPVDVKRELVMLSLPAIAGQAIDPLTQLMETAYIGRLGSIELGSAAVSMSIFNTISKLFNIPLLSVSTPFVAEDVAKVCCRRFSLSHSEIPSQGLVERKQLSLVSTALVLAVGIGIFEAVALSLASGPFLRLMGVTSTSEMFIPAQQFLVLRALGAPAYVVSLALQGIFRGFKDMKIPVYCLGIGNFLAIFLFPLFIYQFKMGVAGAAISSVISQYTVTIFNDRAFVQKSYTASSKDGLTKVWRLPKICVLNLTTNVMSFKSLFKTLSDAGEKTEGVQLDKASRKGTRVVNLSFDCCCVNFRDCTLIDDPKSVTPRTASTLRLKYLVTLEISQFSFCLNKDKQSTEMEAERGKSIYQEYLDQEHQPCSKITLFDMHNVKHVRLNKMDVRSLFSVTDISLGWEADAHLSLCELFSRMRSLVYNKDVSSVKDSGPCETINLSDSVDKQKKMECIFAIDVEMLTISTKVKDGVEVKSVLKSIFTENASAGVLFEETVLAFNGYRVFKTTRMQMSRIRTASSYLIDAAPVMASGPWDWVVQGLDVHIYMPYKLELRAIADSIEEMLQGLALITVEKEKNPRVGESSELSPKLGRLGKLTADIEEALIQGWLDEHYQLMKKEACELAVRLKFLEDFIHKGAETSDPSDAIKMFYFDGVEIDVEDPLAINKVEEEIHKRSFRSYHQACQGLVPSEGSRACMEGFQAGFKLSAARISLLSVCLTDFDLCLKVLHGGDAGLMEILKKIDPNCQQVSGINVDLKTRSLVVRLRNYTLALLSATSSKCGGQIVNFLVAQQETYSQPRISQDVLVGRWRKVKILRLLADTYSDLQIYFEKAEVSFGVGYEPAFADVSYAFTVALSPKNPQVSKEEQSLPWWDAMRNNAHLKPRT